MLKNVFLYINLLMLLDPTGASATTNNMDIMTIAGGCMQAWYEAIMPSTSVRDMGTKHFDDFLANHPSPILSNISFRRGVFGGKENDAQKVNGIPTIPIHGNSDAALGHDFKSINNHRFTGWRVLRNYFLNKNNYTDAELYGLSWGFAKPSLASKESHTTEYIMAVREYILAVLEYSGAEKVNIVAHSMGNTMAAKAIRGGKLHLGPNRVIDLGEDISDKIANFVSASPAWHGIDLCKDYPLEPTCNKYNGFHPDSHLMKEFKTNLKKLADNVLVLWTWDDHILGPTYHAGNMTSSLPFSAQELIFGDGVTLDGIDVGHMNIKDLMAPIIHHWLSLRPGEKNSGKFDMEFYQQNYQNLVEGKPLVKVKRVSGKKRQTPNKVRNDQDTHSDSIETISEESEQEQFDFLKRFFSWAFGPTD